MRLTCFAFAVVLGLAGCLFGGTFGENKGKKPERHLSPTRVRGAASAPAKKARALRVIRLHVYADADYRSSVPRWKPRFRNLVGRANKILGPMLDLRLEVAATGEWDRKADPADLEALLAELVALDAGGKQLFVVGLAPSLPQAATHYDAMGAAVLGGRHMFIRNLDDLEEHRALESGWDDLSREERDAIYLERKRHRELVVFLHELGHLFGVDHHRNEEGVMYEGYLPTQRGFTNGTIATMRGALVEELAGTRDDLAARVAEDQAREARVTAGYAIDKAERATGADDAAAHLQEAELALARYGEEAGDLWARVAAVYSGHHQVTLAEQALARAGRHGSAEMHRWVVRMRARFAIPANAVALGLTPANERSYIEHYNSILAAIAADDYDRALTLARTGRKRLGDLPGFDVAACDVAMRRHKWARAAALCKRAIERCETASWAHFLAGHLAQRGKQNQRAAAHYQRAIALDPELVQARNALDDLRRASAPGR